MVRGFRVVYISSKKASSISETILEEKINMMVSVPLFLDTLKNKIEKAAEEKGKLENLKKAVERFKNYPKSIKKIIFRKVRQKFKSLEFVVVGGSAFDPETEKFWEAIGITVLQGYGLTETSPILTSNKVGSKKFNTVGRAINGIEIKIKDSEIIARGDSIFQGYYKNVKETKEVLKNGWLYTGDIGEIDKQGFLKITGRKKNMILSSSGTNVYPEDIEKVLNKYPGVKESVVLGLNNGNDIVGVILENKKINTDKLLKWANSQLSSHQYLSKIYIWDEIDFPRTPTKKVKRRFVEQGLSIGKKETIKSKDDLINIISEVCDVNSSKVKEPTLLKNIGLDSLKRIELSMKIEEILNVDFNEDEITEKTTVKGLREIIKSTKAIGKKSGLTFLNSRMFNPLRFVLQWIIFILTRLAYKTKVTGKENIPEEQCIFIANHTSHLDIVEIMRALSVGKRLNTGFAAAKDVFFTGTHAYVGPFARLFYNTFPFARDKGIKQSLEDFGDTVNRGFNVVIFPEGTRTITGKMNKFKNGIGLITWNMELPVVPIKINGLYEIMPRGQFYWKFSRKGAEVKIGKPIKFNQMQSPIEITKILEETIKKL